MSVQTILMIVYMVPPLLVAVILHEIAHGKVAEILGDPTARSANRINLNPLVHIDLFLTILLPLALILSNAGIVFGGAKPVPVNPGYFKNPRRGMLWVALAGPVTNFILAFLHYLAFLLVSMFLSVPEHGITSLWDFVPLVIIAWCVYGVVINLVLGIFNLLPVPPLDGGRIVTGLLPSKLAYQYMKLERVGFLLVVVLIYYNIPQMVLEPVIDWVSLRLR